MQKTLVQTALLQKQFDKVTDPRVCGTVGRVTKVELKGLEADYFGQPSREPDESWVIAFSKA